MALAIQNRTRDADGLSGRCGIISRRWRRPRSVDPETVIAQMRRTPVDDFFAHGGKVREDGRMVHDMYLMRIKKPEESKQK